MKKYGSLFPLTIILIFNSCRQTPLASTDKYFSIPDYLQQEIPNLLQQYHRATKITISNDQADTAILKLDSVELQNYFHPFIAADITKPALRGTYKMESFPNSGAGYLSVTYTSMGKNTRPYQVVLNIGADSNLKNLYITSYSNNVLYRSSQKLLYQAGKFIEIIKNEKMILLSPKKVQVKILFEN